VAVAGLTLGRDSPEGLLTLENVLPRLLAIQLELVKDRFQLVGGRRRRVRTSSATAAGSSGMDLSLPLGLPWSTGTSRTLLRRSGLNLRQQGRYRDSQLP